MSFQKTTSVAAIPIFFLTLYLFIIRYHYNVVDARLAQHVERGFVDSLLRSCVSSCCNLWGLIIDGGTGFSNQLSL